MVKKIIIDDIAKFDWTTMKNKTVRYDGKLVKFGLSYYGVSDLDVSINFENGDNRLPMNNLVKPFMDAWNSHKVTIHTRAFDKRQAILAAAKEEAKSNTYTSFEWRLKLLNDHHIYVERNSFSPGRFMIYVDAYTANVNMKRSWITYKEGHYAGTIAINGVFNDKTIKMVVDKSFELVNRTAIKNYKETIKAIERLA